MIDVGKEIHVKRIQKGWTQSELARQSSVTKVSINHYEHGRCSPTWQTANLLFEALGYEVVLKEKI